MSDWLGLVGRVVAEKFRVDRLLGEGGHGVVYAGIHLVLGVPVAIKFIKPPQGGGGPQDTEAFLREARMLFSLTHPAIVRLYEVGTLPFGPNMVPFVVLELLDGIGLDRALVDRRAQGRAFSATEILQLMGPLFEGLSVAHAQGVSHRDLKPSNLMLTRGPSGTMEPKILDFGTARSSAQLMQSATVTGFTPLYSAPEQWDPRFGPTSPRTDVFAMGLTLAEVCTLQQVFANMTSMAQLMQAVANPAHRPRVRASRPDLPHGLDELVLRATAVGPQDRFPDAAAMYQEMRRVFQADRATGPLPPRAPSVAPPPLATLGAPPQFRTSVAPADAMPQPATLGAPPQFHTSVASADAMPHAITTGAPYALPVPPSPFAPVPAAAPAPPEGSAGTIPLVVASVALVAVLGLFLYAGVLAKPPSKFHDEGPSPAVSPTVAATGPRPVEMLPQTTFTPPPPPANALAAADVTGAAAWAPNEIATFVRARTREIDACTQTSAAFTGRATLLVTTDAKGSVVETTCGVTNGARDLTAEGEVGALNFCACVEERVRTWRLPAVKRPAGPLRSGSFNLGFSVKPAPPAPPPRGTGRR